MPIPTPVWCAQRQRHGPGLALRRADMPETPRHLVQFLLGLLDVEAVAANLNRFVVFIPQIALDEFVPIPEHGGHPAIGVAAPSGNRRNPLLWKSDDRHGCTRRLVLGLGESQQQHTRRGSLCADQCRRMQGAKGRLPWRRLSVAVRKGWTVG